VGDSFVPLVSRRSRIGNDADRSVAKAPDMDIRGAVPSGPPLSASEAIGDPLSAVTIGRKHPPVMGPFVGNQRVRESVRGWLP
jgi:hypothetical protein